jgi:hypothetical protein
MSKAKMRDESRAVSRTYGTIRRERTHDGTAFWYHGSLITRWGIVTVYGEERFSRYDFVHGGRHYIRTEDRQRTERGLTIMAVRFARDVSRG